MTLSQELRAAIKLSPTKQYVLAQAVGVHPATLSAWLNGIYPVHDTDVRVLKLAELLGVPKERVFCGEGKSAFSTRCVDR